jgi:hypothetical protein
MTAHVDEISEWLSSIESDGRITPEKVVDAARDPDCPAHDLFEWDDAKAASKYRLDQARELLAKRIKIVTDSYTIMVPRYVRDPEARAAQQSYVSIRKVSEAGLQHQALANEFVRIGQMLDRARELARAFGLVEEVERLSSEVRAVAARLPSPPQLM